MAKTTDETKGQPPLPRFKHMKPFSLEMFKYSPLLEHLLPEFETMYADFSSYKRSISTYGAILLNSAGTKLALCRVWQGKSWMIPGGKVNQHESGKDAAARETYEETGFDPKCEHGVCAQWKEQLENGEDIAGLSEDALVVDDGGERSLPWRPLQDGDKLLFTEKDTKKRKSVYICRGVPEEFPFEPVARKEVSEVAFHSIDNLPKKTFGVLPFIGQLKKWIKKDNKRREGRNATPKGRKGSSARRRESSNVKPRNNIDDKQEDVGLQPFFAADGAAPWEESVQSDDQGSPSKSKRAGSKKRDASRGKKGSKKRHSSRGRSVVDEDDPLVVSALVSPGESDRWTEDDMFAKNEMLLGRKITYDGNPHDFAEKGFSVEGDKKVDPHCFRVVGGSFMNDASGGVGRVSAPPAASAMQPLVARARSASKGEASAVSGMTSEGTDMGADLLTPFFSNEGKAPWEGPSDGGVVVTRLQSTEPAAIRSARVDQVGSNAKGLSLLGKLRKGSSAIKPSRDESLKNGVVRRDESGVASGDFMTDREITAKSQKEKLSSAQAPTKDAQTAPVDMPLPPIDVPKNMSFHNQQQSGVHESNHLKWMRQWARNLPQSAPTETFGDFRLDVDAVMAAAKEAMKV